MWFGTRKMDTSRRSNQKLFALLVTAAIIGAPAVRGYQINGPTIGYIVDSTSRIRTIDGIPGASAIGAPVNVSTKIRHSLFLVKGDYALAVSEDTGKLLLITHLSSVPEVSPITSVAEGAKLFALSPDGSSAAVYSPGASLLQIIGGLPLDPVVRFEVETKSMRQITAIGINTNGQVLAADSDGNSGSLYLVGPDGVRRFIQTVGNVSSIAYDVSGDRALVADRGSNDVFLIQNLSGNASSFLLAGRDGASIPAAVAFSSDGKTAYIANRGSETITVANLAGGTPRSVPCRCQPTTMTLLRDSLYVVTERTDQPIALLDASGDEARVRFVPPATSTDK